MDVFNNISLFFAKRLMKSFPSNPTFENRPYNWEIFNHKKYIEATEEDKRMLRRQSAQNRYEYEIDRCFFDVYFPQFTQKDFLNCSILEIGSFTGGSLVQWTERYGFVNSTGIDISPVFAKAGNEFAKEKGINATFETGVGENLPYPDNSFDYIVNFDVLEHVRDVEVVIKECFRVLKPGGKLMAVFPPFFQPLEAHLGMVTKLPALHWLFSGKTLTKAYNQIIKERGEEAYWYKLENQELLDWEKLPTLNGITVKKFRKIIKNNKSLKIDYWGTNPLFSDGKKSDNLLFQFLSMLFIIPAKLPFLEEFFLGRISCVIIKSNS